MISTTKKIPNLDSITLNRNPSLDEEVSKKISVMN